MIAGATFGPPRGGVRPLRFVPRASIPLAAACLVANAVREALRELFGERCELALGEPAALGAAAWRTLARDAELFLTPGLQTDVVLLVPHADARRLVRRAFGEAENAEAPPSALERGAVARIAERCTLGFDALCAERSGGPRRVASHEVPACTSYFDLRLAAPVAATLGIGIVRELPDPGPSGRLAPGVLDGAAVPLRVAVAAGALSARAIATLRPGDVVPLDTALDAPARLLAGARTVAAGVPGARHDRRALRIEGA